MHSAQVSCCAPPNGPGLLCSFIFSLSQTGFFVPISVPPPLPLLYFWRNRTAGTATNKLWYASLSLVTLIAYSITTGGLIWMAVFYTQKDGCMENKILLGVNGGLCLLMSVVSISPSVRDRKYEIRTSLFIL